MQYLYDKGVSKKTIARKLSSVRSFYNYLYEQIKGEQYNSYKIIDGTICLCVPIPTAEQTKYPINMKRKLEK